MTPTNQTKSLVLLLLSTLFISSTALAQVNLQGVWRATYAEDQADRIPGPEIADFVGLPVNAANRVRALSWDASLLTLPEYQCRVHPSDYANQFNNIRIWEERNLITEELIAIHLKHAVWETHRVIWMDGRKHPTEYAEHTSMGFSTGRWDGHILTVKTTHLTEGWLRRNGVARSDMATVTEHFIRNEDILSWTVRVVDPVYLEEPFVRNRDYYYSTDIQIPPYPCESVTEVERERGEIPHYLPGLNPLLTEFSEYNDIPFEAAMGGAASMYPEYMEALEAMLEAQGGNAR